jgi:pimeloyl-ACP methyl ester carboxylesterase
LLNWPADVAEVADGLGISQFAVAGHSGGGPYVLACVHQIPARITAAALISSFAPLDAPHATEGMMGSNKLMFSLAKQAPWLHKLLLSFMVGGGVDRFMQGMVASLPEVDKAIMGQLEKGEEDIAEAFRHGVQGPAWDQYILVRPWGFRLEEITAEICLWQGDHDVMVPLPMGQYLAKTLPKCQATFCAGEGHMLIFPRWTEILAKLAGQGQP